MTVICLKIAVSLMPSIFITYPLYFEKNDYYNVFKVLKGDSLSISSSIVSVAAVPLLKVTYKKLYFVGLFTNTSEARQLKSIEPLLDDKDLKKVKDISQDAARS